jgi:beta-lactamase regulating signal transducer with metallopeptidase domain
MNAAELLGHAWSLIVWATAASVVIMLIGVPLRAWFGPGHAYAAWAFLPIALLTSMAPRLNPVIMPTSVGHSMRVLSAAMPSVPHIPAPAHDLALLVAWISGSLAMVGVMTLRHVHYMHLLRDATPVSGHDGLRVVSSHRWPYGPATVSVFHPRIVLPADFDARYDVTERALVLQHEAVHVRRHDTLWNMLATILVALAWFNPLLHAAWRRFRRDQELACDDAVVRRTGARRTYAEAMLKTVRPVPALSAVCGWLGNHSLQERIMMLNKPSRSSSRRHLATALLVVSMTVASVGLYATDLPNAATEVTVRITVGQQGQEVTDNIACVEQEQRVTIPYDRSQKDFGDLNFRVNGASDGKQWEIHDLVRRDYSSAVDFHSNGFYGDRNDPSTMTFVTPDDVPVHGIWNEGQPDAMTVDIRVTPGCGTTPVTAR